VKYLVMTRRLPSFDPQWLDAHYAFLADLRARDRLEQAGPFTDGTGGAYVLLADSRPEAEALAHQDPLHVNRCSDLQILEWRAS
jgi:uncharacterized protein YciI